MTFAYSPTVSIRIKMLYFISLIYPPLKTTFIFLPLFALPVIAGAQIKTGFEYLKGRWVKEGNEKDTLNFISEGNFILTLQHGSKPPHDPEGPYNYKFTKNGIVLQWSFSSTVDPNKKAVYYSLNDSHTRLTLGKFYPSGDPEERMIFNKIEQF